ncbi:MAG: 30S ribosomal protein S13 [Candidatus Woesearchaeota archaeon]
MAEFRHIVRVGNTDLKGEKALYLALQKIKGVGENFARSVCTLAAIDYMKTAGDLTDKEVKALENVLEDPKKAGMPEFYLNRIKDFETGKDKHLLLADLDYEKDQDIKRMKKMKSYIGLRHQWRLPVRGQRTGSNFRPNRGRGTVKKKKTTIRK